MSAPLDLFVTTLPGLEDVLAGELAALGLTGRPERGGVELAGVAPGDLMRLNLELRTAGRVLLRCGSFGATSFAALRRHAAALAWERWLSPDTPVVFRVTSRKSRLYHGRAVAERLAEAVSERLGAPVIVASPTEGAEQGAALVVASVERDVVRLSVDSSGEPLHRRGWRLETAKAPVRETLAAAMLLLSGWDRRSPLVDPFCGSGTIAIEAALMAAGAAPGLGRRFAFERWAGHDAPAWESLREAARSAVRPPPAPVVASDRDGGAVEVTRRNAARAGVLEHVEIVERSVSDLEPPPRGGGGPGAVVTNPPHGRRVSGESDLVPLYGRFGAVVRKRLPGWRVVFLTSSVRYQTATRLAVTDTRKLDQGGQPVRLVVATA